MGISLLQKMQLIDRGPEGMTGRTLDALPDVPDIRDRYYEPALLPLKSAVTPQVPQVILDQGTEGACTGFGLAAVINALLQQRELNLEVSPWMLYVMARRHDEWPGDDYSGSSLRGALRGWFNNGVCEDTLWAPGNLDLTVDQAKNARNITLGAYYRLRPNLVDFHAALNECSVLYVSAAVHDGWGEPVKMRGRATIQYSPDQRGFHAFAVIGYNNKGFWVQNSWGAGWGVNGIALWTYEDWAMNIQDAWVVRLAVSTPQVFGYTSRETNRGPAEFWGKPPAPTRNDIAGHFVHIDDGKFSDERPYWSSPADVKETAQLIRKRFEESGQYKHLLIYAHGGLNSPEACATRVQAMTPVLMENGIYPYSIMYDTGLGETLKDVIFNRGEAEAKRAGNVFDFTDMMLETALKGIGGKLWGEMKLNARQMFDLTGAGRETLQIFIKELASQLGGTDIKLHLVGHSLGSVVVGHMINALREEFGGPSGVSSCSLMAPACSVDFLNDRYAGTSLGDFAIYNLTDTLEKDDNVGFVYRKSLLYLVSNAFEPTRHMPLAGMQKFASEISVDPTIHYAGSTSEVTRSKSHGGFDNDRYTMNHILGRILGAAPKRPFKDSDLDY